MGIEKMKWLLKYYYKIWVDIILFEQIKNKNHTNWQFISMVFITGAQSLNYITFFMFLMLFGIKVDIIIDIDILPTERLNTALSGLISPILPFVVLNYFLIFKDRKYLKLIERYEYKKGKLALPYFIISFILFFVPVIIYSLNR